MFATHEARQKLLALKEQVAELFKKEDWINLGLLTGFQDQIQGHGRLLRSLYFGDDDYSGEAVNMLLTMVNTDERNLVVIERYLSDKFGSGGTSVSSVASTGRRMYFTPEVFQIPDEALDPKRVSVMRPFPQGCRGCSTTLNRSATNSH